jgi:hypothetical protein
MVRKFISNLFDKNKNLFQRNLKENENTLLPEDEIRRTIKLYKDFKESKIKEF